MVSITCIPTSVWSTGYNAVITIKNNTPTNYISNWEIVCDIPQGSSISWCDSLKISSNIHNKVILSLQPYTPVLNSGTTLNINLGGIGSVPIIYTFVYNGDSQPAVPTPKLIVPIPTPKPIVPTPKPIVSTPKLIMPVPTPKPIVHVPTPKPSSTITPVISLKKKVVYLGYWITDSIVAGLTTSLKNAGVTHVLITFVVHPSITGPLAGNDYMLGAFRSLSLSNQQILISNFKIGISLGGALNMPVPYSQTFLQPSAYYYNNPSKYAQDLFNLVKGTGLQNYFDLDIEGINDMFPQCADFIGQVCKELKSLNPLCHISHAPQPPYFTPQFGNVYTLIYQKYNQYFDFLNIQYYNNGPSQTFEHIFVKSDASITPLTSVLELINKGIKSSYIVVGKTVPNESNSSNGYIDLTKMAKIVQQAYNTQSLASWSSNGGVMIWYFDSQNLSNPNNAIITNYFSSI